MGRYHSEILWQSIIRHQSRRGENLRTWGKSPGRWSPTQQSLPKSWKFCLSSECVQFFSSSFGLDLMIGSYHAATSRKRTWWVQVRQHKINQIFLTRSRPRLICPPCSSSISIVSAAISIVSWAIRFICVTWSDPCDMTWVACSILSSQRIRKRNEKERAANTGACCSCSLTLIDGHLLSQLLGVGYRLLWVHCIPNHSGLSR